MNMHVTIKIEGMTCNHCVHAVKSELSTLPLTVAAVEIGSAQIDFDDAVVSRGQIEAAVVEAGYRVVAWEATKDAPVKA